MRHLQISLAVILLLFAFGAKPAMAERPCPGGTCKCAGANTADCEQLNKSGQCNGPITCGHPGEQCGCVSKFKATTTSTIQKKPVSKSQ